MPRLVEAIMEAEKEAAKIIQEAEEEAKRIIEEAKNTPVEVSVMEDIEKEVREIVNRARAKAEEFRRVASERMDSLVEEVVREVLEGEWGGSS